MKNDSGRTHLFPLSPGLNQCFEIGCNGDILCMCRPEASYGVMEERLLQFRLAEIGPDDLEGSKLQLVANGQPALGWQLSPCLRRFHLLCRRDG